jgi:hypothetical protein
LVTDPKAPLLLGTQGALVIALIIGVAAQVFYLRSQRQKLGRSVELEGT